MCTVIALRETTYHIRMNVLLNNWSDFVAYTKRQIAIRPIGIEISACTFKCKTVARPQFMPDKFTQNQMVVVQPLYTKYQLMLFSESLTIVGLYLSHYLSLPFASPEAHQPSKY